MKIRQIEPHVYHVTYPTTQMLARAFFPFQEFYENVYFADTVFSREEFETWYEKTYPGQRYQDDWTGFNVPLYFIERFRKDPTLKALKESDPLSLELFEVMTYLGPDAYVIGTAEDVDPETLEHEKRHARFYRDDMYRALVSMILEDANITALERHLEKISYHPKVILDECHAYIATEEAYLREHGLWTEEFAEIRKRIKEL